MEKLSEKKSKWQMGVSSTLQGGWGGKIVVALWLRGGAGAVGEWLLAARVLQLQFKLQPQISMGFGQQVGAKRGKGYTNHHQLVSLVNVYQTVRQL